MTKTTHTPTKWKIGDKPIEISGTFYEVLGANGIPTSFLQERIDQDLSDRSAIKNHEADAAFIVTAVNAHEAMKTALEQILRMSPATPVYDVAWNVLNSLRRAEGV